jgi:MFS transporter, DHA2 family, multidrug resistance protein
MTATAIMAPAPERSVNRTLATLSIMVATTMTQLDTTIANVALPHMAGAVSASADQITWVLTSYIVASAILTPMSGWFAARVGRKQVFIISIIGFTAASAMCGAAQNLAEIVVFRVLQGMFAAAMMPLAQSVIIDLYPLEERGQAMSIWSIGALVAPIAGPVLGGWLTQDFSWRWVFYINLPFGALALFGVWNTLPDDKIDSKRGFDAIGFALLSLSVAALQICLDRGQGKGWFDSNEIVLEAALATLAFVLFLVHSVTAEKPFIPMALFKDWNFIGGSMIGFFVGTLIFSVLALLPTLMQTLMGYPVVTSGILTAPRGFGSVISMVFAGRLVNRMDARVMMLTGLIGLSFTFFEMSGFSLQMDYRLLVVTGFIQGLATGLIFLPMSMLVFATLNPALRSDGAGVNALIRNMGSALGISIMQTLFIRNSATAHARLAEPFHPDNPVLQATGGAFSLATPQGMAGAVGEVSRQAAMVAYTDVFRLMSIVTLVLAPLVLMVRPLPSSRSAPEEPLMAE